MITFLVVLVLAGLVLSFAVAIQCAIADSGATRLGTAYAARYDRACLGLARRGPRAYNASMLRDPLDGLFGVRARSSNPIPFPRTERGTAGEIMRAVSIIGLGFALAIMIGGADSGMIASVAPLALPRYITRWTKTARLAAWHKRMLAFTRAQGAGNEIIGYKSDASVRAWHGAPCMPLEIRSGAPIALGFRCTCLDPWRHCHSEGSGMRCDTCHGTF